MSSEQEQQQQQVVDQQEVDDGYSSSEDEWTRPAADSIVAKNNSEGAEDMINSTSVEEKAVDYSWDQDEKTLAGNDVKVVFVIEKEGEAPIKYDAIRFVMGQTIAHLKSHLEDTKQIPYTQQRMFLGERELIDPLSLNDLGFVGGDNSENQVKVLI